MKILACDQSYTCSGIVVISDGEMTFCEKYKTNKEDDKFKRAWELAEHLQDVAKTHNVDVVAIEGLAFGSVGNATRDLAGLQWTVVNVLTELDGYEVKIYSPQTVKKFATGKGNSKKEVLMEVLPEKIRGEFDLLGVKKTTGLLDLTDAYWIGMCAEQEILNG